MPRPAIVLALPATESVPVATELLAAGFEVIEVDHPTGLERALDARRDVSVAILDGEADDDEAHAYADALRATGRSIPALTVVSARTFERLAMREDDGIRRRVLHPTLLGRRHPLADRGHVHPP